MQQSIRRKKKIARQTFHSSMSPIDLTRDSSISSIHDNYSMTERLSSRIEKEKEEEEREEKNLLLKRSSNRCAHAACRRTPVSVVRTNLKRQDIRTRKTTLLERGKYLEL